MPKSFQRKAFDRWLSRNRGLFHHPPVIIENRKTYFAVGFRNINSAIDCTITSHGYGIGVTHEGEVWDFIECGDLSEKRTPSGQYFCNLCKPEYRELFPTRSALWEDHIFKPILGWANHNLLKTKWVCLSQYGKGATMAQVVDENSLLTVMQDDSFVKAIPMMEHQIMPILKSDTMENKNSDDVINSVAL